MSSTNMYNPNMFNSYTPSGDQPMESKKWKYAEYIDSV